MRSTLLNTVALLTSALVGSFEVTERIETVGDGASVLRAWLPATSGAAPKVTLLNNSSSESLDSCRSFSESLSYASTSRIGFFAAAAVTDGSGAEIAGAAIVGVINGGGIAASMALPTSTNGFEKAAKETTLGCEAAGCGLTATASGVGALRVGGGGRLCSPNLLWLACLALGGGLSI